MNREELVGKVNKYLTKQFICNPGDVPDDECELEAKETINLIEPEIRADERAKIAQELLNLY